MLFYFQHIKHFQPQPTFIEDVYNIRIPKHGKLRKDFFLEENKMSVYFIFPWHCFCGKLLVSYKKKKN